MRFNCSIDSIVLNHHPYGTAAAVDITQYLVVLLDGEPIDSVTAFDTEEGWVEEAIYDETTRRSFAKRKQGKVTIVIGSQAGESYVERPTTEVADG